MTPEKRRVLAGMLASSIGSDLDQEYRHTGGRWWLFTLGEAKRPLTAEEIAWHVARNHSPFVTGGIEKGDPRWWDDPE